MYLYIHKIRGTKKNKSCFEPPQGQFVHSQPITLFQLPDVWPLWNKISEIINMQKVHQSDQMC